MVGLTRRRLIASTAPVVGLGAVALGQGSAGAQHAGHAPADANGHGGGSGAGIAGHGGHAAFRGGDVDHEGNGFDPHEVLRDFDWGRTRRLPSGRVVREWTLIAGDREVELAPGVRFAAWTYNGRIPGPTLRAREGELLRITFVNGSAHPHTIHFHGIHPAAMDGVAGLGDGEIAPGGRTVYEFDATPAGVHLYHCHVRPLAEHIAKGLYGTFIVDPAEGREDADELVMVMNGFDTNFDRANELYAVNSIGFAYMDRPVQVVRDELVRIYLVNVLEYDLINSFHVHGNFFDWYPTGTSRRPAEHTDTVMLCQGQRGIAEMRFGHLGRFMFHAHQSEFTELGWQGFFEVCERRGGRLVCDLPEGRP
ncbi:multicopper oxidase domain-containing protein [Conexibacter sp. SYSU D00693]|uniref:multicopper oxidase domain-containing protein n=1 Tax=Conexibacter sp. SYSU D00693 TaxID=2812560 RepID=UPI00196B4598|nr:multicopper oxidase domain-containing protein [Conexibacter sp. SYSU D00693]